MPVFGAVSVAGGSSRVRKSTALVTPKVSAPPNDMSAMSACVSPLSAVWVVGFLLNWLLSLSAMTPNTVPTPAATMASPPVTYAGTLLGGSGGGGGGAGGAGAGSPGAGGGGGGGGRGGRRGGGGGRRPRRGGRGGGGRRRLQIEVGRNGLPGCEGHVDRLL